MAPGVQLARLGAWERWLAAHGVALDGCAEWDRGGRSVHFRDPGGHSVELGSPGTWENH